MADVGTGTTIVFGTSSFAAEVLQINGENVSRAVIDTSHMGTTGARTKMPGDLHDEGEVTMNIAFNPNNEIPVDAAVETITITFPVPSGDSNGATAAGSGFISGYSWTDPLEDKMTADITITWADDVTWTDSS